MKKIFSLLFFVVLGYSFTYAGTWVIGANQVGDLLNKIEQGTGDVPPAVPEKTDLELWEKVDGITLTKDDVVTTYQDHSNESNHWRGFYSINFEGKGYKQVEGTTIILAQPSLVEFDYSGVPEGYEKFSSYFDAMDLSWLETLNLSGNDFHTLEIDGGPYEIMPLKTLNLSGNRNLTSLSITNCAKLEVVNISGTGLSADAIEEIKESVWEFSPDAQIISDGTSINTVDASASIVYMQGNSICIKNKAPESKVLVYDLFGRLLVESYTNTLDASSFGNGVYLVKVNNQVTKILKK